ncbi:hypothetical protein O3P69_006319 [Scylla paramamosain]|uniref:Uncharacterized protein n=1 Tax=Scylla paramamosain TaxID=85552 RepID=A0AAW0U5I6_SCYPA
MLRKMDEAATEEYIQLLETSLRQGIPDCVNQDTMDEVAEMIIRIKGSPRNWKTADNVSCILDTFSSEGISRIASELPADVLITTGCPQRSNQFMSIPKHCKDASMRAMKAMKSRKTEKCIERRGTLGTGDSMRDSMMCGNAARMTQSQLERMKKEDVMKYLDNLVTEDLGTGEAKVILTKVKENKELKDMNGEELARLKNAWEGLTKQDVGNLPTLTATENLEVLYQLGMTKMLPDDVMVALRDKIIAEKQPEEMTDMDVFLLGDIVCHFNQSQTSKIPKDVIKKSMRHLGMRDCKTQYGTQNLAEAVKAAYGDVKDFDAATVHEMNRLVSGLKPEDLSALSGDAYVGFTAEGIEQIEPDTLKVMTVAQANNLDGKTAAAVTSEQVRVLPSEVKNALSSAKSEQLRRSSASGLSMPGVMGAVVAAVLFLL